MLHAGVVDRDIGVGAVDVAPVLIEHSVRRSPEALALMLGQDAQMRDRHDRSQDSPPIRTMCLAPQLTAAGTPSTDAMPMVESSISRAKAK